MDVMQLRRGLMMAMAKGLPFETGSFTVPINADTYLLEYSKSYNSYIILIEMDDASKEILQNAVTDNASSVLYYGLVPDLAVGEYTYQSMLRTYTFTPSTHNFATGSLLSTAMTDSSLSLATKDIDAAGTTRIVRGLTYNYIVISLDDV